MEVIVIDFDGTVVTHEYPRIGRELPLCVETLRELIDNGVKLCLNTMRSDKYLDDAVNWFNERHIPLFGVNENPTQKSWTNSPKVYGGLYIDDAALGCPLINDGIGRAYVDWEKVRIYLKENKYI